jgi:hypothetical protein
MTQDKPNKRTCLEHAVYEAIPMVVVTLFIIKAHLQHTTAYRKIRWLVEEKLLVVDKIEITDEGKKSSLFHTVLKSFNVKYEYNNVVIEAEQNFDTLKKFCNILIVS